jgi:hypothetical protein
MPINAHKALGGSRDEAYLNQLRLPKDRENQLRDTRDVLRSEIKAGLRDWDDRVDVDQIVTPDVQIALMSEGASVSDAIGRPKFRMQGSFSYATVVDPAKAKSPPQQVDLDDGMFLPVRFVGRDGTLAPAVAAQGYFRVVESIVSDVCAANGWTMKVKSSCVRVEIDDEAHIDIALYAVPDREFAGIVETARSQGRLATASMSELRDEEFRDVVYRSLPQDQMRLACRDKDGGGGHWIPSDPRKLEDWFRDAVKDHGEQVRSVSRYLKAWRDEQDLDGLASITLMWAVIKTFETHGGYRPFVGRDDLALLEVARALPDILHAAIPNPVVDDARLDQGWSAEARAAYVAAAETLVDSLEAAITQSPGPATTIQRMIEQLGDRFPTDHALLSDDVPENAAAPAAPAILSHGAFETKADERPAVKLGGDERYA